MDVTALRSARPRASTYAAWLACITFAFGTSVHPGGTEKWTAFADIGEMVTPFIALAACLLTARRCVGRERTAWLLIGIGAGAWGLGEGLWTIWEVGFGRQPVSPSVCDVGYLLSPVLMVTGLMLFVETPAAFLSRIRGIFEAALITFGLLLPLWALLIHPVVAGSEEPVAEQLVLIAYPVFDMVALAAVVFAATRQRTNQHGSLALIGVGFGCLALADSMFWYLTTVRDYSSVNPTDSGWFVGFLLVAYGARGSRGARAAAGATSTSAPTPTRRHSLRTNLSPTHRRWLAAVVPELVAIIGVGIGSVARGSTEVGADSVFVNLLFVVAAITLVHALSVLIENHALTTHLETRITERTAQIAAGERYFSALIEHSSDATLVVTEDYTVQSATRSSRAVFGVAADELVGTNLADFDGVFGELLDNIRTSTNVPGTVRKIVWEPAWGLESEHVVESHLTNLVHDPDVKGYVINSRDITEQVRLEREIRHQAFHDNLTSLANRALFRDRGEHAIARASRTRGQVAVMLIDLDGFKHVNDSLGHEAGDILLRKVSTRLRAETRAGDTLARLGGDEFAVLMEDLEAPSEALDLAERLRVILTEAFPIEGYSPSMVTASIGVRFGAFRGATIDELLRDADIAMYVAKSSGKNAVQLFEPWMHDQAAARFKIQNELAGALDRGEFVLYYQPCWTLDAERLEGFEALVRWNHPSLGLVPPDRFIPLAEETGLIIPLGEWVLQEATRQLAEWQRERPDCADLTIAVNVSARQVRDHRLAEQVDEAIRTSGVRPEQIVLEITESVLVHDPVEVARLLQSLRALGVRIAIDDFGTGYSSLSYLRGLPVDILKIDKVFVTENHDDRAVDNKMLGAIVNLARTLGLKTIAEGVEHASQATVLTRYGCDLAQGFLWSRPLPAGGASALMGELAEAAHHVA